MTGPCGVNDSASCSCRAVLAQKIRDWHKCNPLSLFHLCKLDASQRSSNQRTRATETLFASILLFRTQLSRVMNLLRHDDASGLRRPKLCLPAPANVIESAEIGSSKKRLAIERATINILVPLWWTCAVCLTMVIMVTMLFRVKPRTSPSLALDPGSAGSCEVQLSSSHDP